MKARLIIYISLIIQLVIPHQIHKREFEKDQCSANIGLEVIWKQCLCFPVGSDHALHIICQQMTSATVPPILDSEKEKQPNDLDIVALSMTDGALAFIQQDAFKHFNIQTLDFSNNQIQTVNVNAFRGLEMKLTMLNLKHNNLSVIPAWALTYLHQLQFLHLENNRITHVRPNTFDETQLNSLQFLHLDHNKLKIIPNLSFQRLRLIVLTLANNRILEIEKMSLPPTLSFLDLRNNLLTGIPFLALKDLGDLQTINIEGNNITLLGFHQEVQFKNEINVILRNNKIRWLDENSFRSFRKMKELDLSYNQIERIHQSSFETVSTIRNLDLSYNQIAYIPHGTFKNFAKNMEKLNLEENIIHTLPDALRDLHSLSHLNLNGNKLNKLDPNSLHGVKKTITELLLAYNQLKEIPTALLNGMEKLQHLDLSKNKIESIEKLAFGTFDGTGTSLIILNLAGNNIRNISDPGVFLYMSTLAYLDLSYNSIEHLGPKAFEKLPGLEKLFLQNNKLKNFPLSALYNMHKLRHLVLDNNKINHLPAYALGDVQKLEHLSLAHNIISRIDEKMFHSSSTRELKSLNLANNKIEHISSEAFANLENLQYLRLSNNRIRILPQRCFTRLKNLRLLDLSENRLIRTTQYAFTNLPSIEHILLHHNAIDTLEKNSFHLIPKIDGLQLNKNKLRKINCEFLGSVNSMSSLDLSHNNINQFELSCVKRNLLSLNLAYNNLQSVKKEMMEDFEELTELSLSHNGILEIQATALQNCPKLNIIDFSHNHIRTIWKNTFASQKMIGKLDLSSNALIALQRGFLGKQNILHINLAHNAFNRVPIEALETSSASLSSLNMDHNQIKTVDSPQLVGLKNISTLSLSNNQIDSIEEAAFEHLTSLQNLDISHNPVTSWSPTAFKDLSHFIVSINLADTGLFSIPKLNHRSIRNMNISHNKIYELKPKDLAAVSKVTTLDISNNNLKTIDPSTFEDLADLKDLNISNNQITHIQEDHLRYLYQLESLCMENMNSLIRLPEPYAFAHLTNLKHLRLTGIPDEATPYNISQIMQHLTPLSSLHIEIKEPVLNTQLYYIDKRLLRDLQIIGKNLTRIEVGAFHGIRGYKFYLSIQNTSIESFPSGIFNTLTSVHYLALSLANNRLNTLEPFKHSLPPAINQHGTILQYLSIQNNLFECDCSLAWLAEWIDQKPDHHKELDTIFYKNKNVPHQALDIYVLQK
ncbi:unnamed protein product [Auanema sp. JU1783]|nr:unnamed protein product [Auanema sp. JU1783]